MPSASGRAEFIERAECLDRVIRMLQTHRRRESQIEADREDTDDMRAYRRFRLSDIPEGDK